ncbi:glycosyltransferase family 2 protein [Aestuariibius sp. HNIBRBA575]|uniref:glycosyltransferase family 2 protein n=1 Tax=Aestuariibius sp. HNIBRBA575 TaxID=3233343 RepID=UPI0034A3358C
MTQMPLITVPLVSIVIPTFHRTDKLSVLLADLAMQIPEDGSVDVVVVDNDQDGSAQAVMPDVPWLHYLIEPSSGVATARNTGVQSARGRYILFIDDDQRPSADWLAQMLAHAKAGHPVCFGPVAAVYDVVPPAPLRRALDPMFSRSLSDPSGAEISAKRAYMGTGNAMFDRQACFQDAVFETQFNGGGEDVWLLRHLAEDLALPFIWVAEAGVGEHVPDDRCRVDFVLRRKRLDGTLRCVVESGGAGPKKWARLAMWMGVGAAQVGLHGLGLIWSGLRRNDAGLYHRAQMATGIGKLIWWTHPFVWAPKQRARA